MFFSCTTLTRATPHTFSICVAANCNVYRTNNRFSKGTAAGNRLYHKSIMANANLALRIPPPLVQAQENETPPSSPERFLTPNATMSMSILNTPGLDDSEMLFRPLNRNNISTPPSAVGPVKSASYASNKSMFNYSDDQINPSQTATPMKRMTSLGNLPLFQRDFGGTPYDIVRMRKDFEAHRFGMARMKSMTDLMEIPKGVGGGRMGLSPVSSRGYEGNYYHNSNNSRYPNTIARDSIFKRNNPGLGKSPNGKPPQRIGIGDTKFIGSDLDRSGGGFISQPGRKLSKNKSMGMIPDLILERAIYEHEHYMNSSNRNGGGEPFSDDNDEEDDEQDEGLGENVMDMTSYERFNVILRNRKGYQVSEPGLRSPEEILGRPFERGYRRSYVKMSSQSSQSPQMMMRQSDGWYTQQYSPGGGGAEDGQQYSWNNNNKMNRYPRRNDDEDEEEFEDVEEIAFGAPVFIARDRNNNYYRTSGYSLRSSSSSSNGHHHRLSTRSHSHHGGDQVDGGYPVPDHPSDISLRRPSNTNSCCSGSVRSKVAKLNQLQQQQSMLLTLPKRSVSAEPGAGGRRLARHSVER